MKIRWEKDYDSLASHAVFTPSWLWWWVSVYNSSDLSGLGKYVRRWVRCLVGLKTVLPMWWGIWLDKLPLLFNIHVLLARWGMNIKSTIITAKLNFLSWSCSNREEHKRTISFLANLEIKYCNSLVPEIWQPDSFWTKMY